MFYPLRRISNLMSPFVGKVYLQSCSNPTSRCRSRLALENRMTILTSVMMGSWDSEESLKELTRISCSSCQLKRCSPSWKLSAALNRSTITSPWARWIDPILSRSIEWRRSAEETYWARRCSSFNRRWSTNTCYRSRSIVRWSRKRNDKLMNWFLGNLILIKELSWRNKRSIWRTLFDFFVMENPFH